jgi:hypothetical protein
MDYRGQSALEYLMTYGWALIVIAIVIGVLIFVTSSATGGVTCQGTTNIGVVEQTVTASTVGLTLRNATGGDINALKVYADGVVFPNATNAKVNGNTLTVAGLKILKNETFTVTGVAGKTGQISNAQVIVEYKTQGGLDANAVVTCSGTVA